MKESRIKLFVAVPVPEDLKEELKLFTETNAHVSNIRWIPPQNYHLTLFFIGYINENKLDIIDEKIKILLAPKNSFNLSFERYSLEGKPSKSSMVWARFNYSDEFETLSVEIGSAIKKELEQVQEFKRKIPHVTLARLRRSVKRNEINLDLNPEINELKISTLQLWQSIGTMSGMIYKNLSEYSLSENN